MSRVTGAVWVLLLLGASIAAAQAAPSPGGNWCVPLVIVMWIVTITTLITSVRSWLSKHQNGEK